MIILFTMIFLHIVDDFYLQGILAQMKQRKWWEQFDNKLYRNDYKVALLTHAFSWAFMTHVPLLIAYRADFPIRLFLFEFTLNWLRHAYIDNLKANKHKISLVADQTLHLVQIVETWILYLVVM